MNLDDLKKMSRDPDLIPGIYNYCDRWWERCYLSSRCLNYKMEMHENRSEASKDLRNKEFWDELSNIFALTFQMIEEIAEEQGIDLEVIDNEQVEYIRPNDPKVKSHPVNKAAEKYFESSTEWLDSYQDIFSVKSNEYNYLVENRIKPDKNINKLFELRDFYEIISWYHSMILVKSKRAVMSSLDDHWDLDEIQNDMNGTAKVVLGCIERSLFAWNGIFQHMPEQEDIALKNLANLQKLKKTIHMQFPNAEKFIRPGFDEN